MVVFLEVLSVIAGAAAKIAEILDEVKNEGEEGN